MIYFEDGISFLIRVKIAELKRLTWEPLHHDLLNRILEDHPLPDDKTLAELQRRVCDNCKIEKPQSEFTYKEGNGTRYRIKECNECAAKTEAKKGMITSVKSQITDNRINKIRNETCKKCNHYKVYNKKYYCDYNDCKTERQIIKLNQNFIETIRDNITPEMAELKAILNKASVKILNYKRKKRYGY